MRKIFMASLALSCLAVSILLFQITSCTKAKADPIKCPDCPICPPNPPCPTPTYPITGLWEGTYLTTQVNHATTYVSFAIYPDGTFIRRSKVSNKDEYAYFKGRWEMSGNEFKFRDTTLSYSGGTIIDIGAATFSNDGSLNSGTWQDVGGQPYSGTFQNMKRIN